MRFLIVDADAEYRRILREHLRSEWPDAAIDEREDDRFEPSPATGDGSHPDLIFFSYLASSAEGLHTLRALLARPGCPPVIVLAPSGDALDAVDAMKCGAASFLPKHRLTRERLVDVVRAELSVESADSVAALLGRRRVGAKRLLGQLYVGHLSSVYLAQDDCSGERIALKVVRRAADAAGARLFDRFLQEYEVIARIRHPHVVRILDFGVADDQAYLAMEYLSAGSLADRLTRPLPPDLAVGYARQIASALGAIHGAGVLHRDLKPANIMFREDGSLALIDFGLAKQIGSDAAITDAGQIFGTPHYMSPEQGRASPTDERSDLYGLGCILYEMLTGERPFTASSAMGVIYKHAHAPRPSLTGSAAYLQPVLDRLLAADPDGRYPTAAALLADLAELAVTRRSVTG